MNPVYSATIQHAKETERSIEFIFIGFNEVNFSHLLKDTVGGIYIFPFELKKRLYLLMCRPNNRPPFRPKYSLPLPASFYYFIHAFSD